MAQSNNLKDNEAVPYHKRIAMGAALDGTSLKSKTPANNNQSKGGADTKNKKK